MKKMYLVVLGLSLMSTPYFYAQSIHGTFYNRGTNEVIDDAWVTFYNEKGQKIIEMMVDQTGSFEINSKNVEKVQKIVGTADGFNSAEVVVSTILDDLEVNFTLTKELGHTKQAKETTVSSGKSTIASASNAKDLLPFYIQYDFNSSYFTDENRAVAFQLLQYMNINTSKSIVVRSYVETRNNGQYNAWMGERRAQRVIDFLIENGISPNRLVKDVVPLAQNATARDGSAGTAKDFRRCDFLLL
ncbi:MULTISPECIES: OmpA family protein [unclassified Myroides]|uniref:OmpA family protein n=1 Tax=unclassified Myroides TaxID=2642485 RepID=UPI003D2F64E1